jgi:nucleoside-diphosphate kinase
MSYMERTLIIVKPEGVQRGLIGNVLTRFERRGLTIVGLKLIHITLELAEKHYGVHKGKPFYEGLVKHITSGPVVVGVLEGPKAISVVRTTMGVTNSAEALPGTIRGDYAQPTSSVSACSLPSSIVKRTQQKYFDSGEYGMHAVKERQQHLDKIS